LIHTHIHIHTKRERGETIECVKSLAHRRLTHEGVYLRDLVYIEELKSKKEDGTVNLEKLEMLYNTLREIRELQQRLPPFRQLARDLAAAEQRMRRVTGEPEEVRPRHEIERIPKEREGHKRQCGSGV
jgi:5'-deoxynucleotidase YfbR-like HD superfamily hydrolase